jgi:hypothetical protein
MPKLTTRQIIILGIMLLAVLYGAYDIFLAGPKKPVVAGAAKTSVDMNAFISDITVAVTKDSPSPVDAYTIKKAETVWKRDPFFERSDYRELFFTKDAAPATATPGVSQPPVQKGQFNYTGYVDVGHKKIALINGSEYAVGDALDLEGFVLKGIYPSRIQIYNKETGRTLDVPLQE